MSEPFLGEIRMFGGNFAPRGWALCNGQLLPISQNSALFAILGTTYGGDGINNFALPNLQGRSPVGMGRGAGLSPIVQGEVAGTENVTLTGNQMPIHNHTATSTPITVNSTGNASVPAATTGASLPAPGPTAILGNIAAGGRPGTLYATTSDTTLASFPINVSGTATPAAPTIGNAGGSLPVAIRNPYLGTNFIIALSGIFPSRN